MAILNLFRATVLGTLFVVFYFGWYNSPQIQKVHRRAIGVPKSCVRDGTIALTFDNGIHVERTPQVLDALQATNVKATFHIAGQYMNEMLVSSIIKRIKNDGHTIGFIYQGNDPNTMTQKDLVDSLNRQAQSIYDIFGIMPKFMRAKLGSTNATNEAWIKEAGYVQSSWSLDTNDYPSCNNPTTLNVSILSGYDSILDQYRKAGANVKGAFISLHTDLCACSDAMRALIPFVQKTYGYEFVTIEDCLGISGKYFGSVVQQQPTSSQTTTSNVGGTGATGTSSKPGTSTNNPNTSKTTTNSNSGAQPTTNIPNTPGAISSAWKYTIPTFLLIGLCAHWI